MMGNTTSDRFGRAMLVLGILTILAVIGSVVRAVAVATSAWIVAGAIVGLGLLMVLLGVTLGFTSRAGDTLRTVIVAFVFPYAATVLLASMFVFVGSIVETLLEVMRGTINYTYYTRQAQILLGGAFALLSILPTIVGVYAVNRDTQDSRITRSVLLLSCARVPMAIVEVFAAQAMGGRETLSLVFVLFASYLVITGFILQHITRTIFAAMLQSAAKSSKTHIPLVFPVPANVGVVAGTVPETHARLGTNSQADSSEVSPQDA